MHIKTEGLILSKTPLKERDLICHLLLRSGRKISVLFFGGRGGGKQQKGSLLEVGYMIKVDLRGNGKHKSDLLMAKEWSLSWNYDLLRSDHNAFYLLCYYLELLEKLAQPVDDSNNKSINERTGDENLFRVISNGIFYLEKSKESNDFDLHKHLIIFLSKIIFELGIVPNLEECHFCEKKLRNGESISFIPQDGGFSCQSCEQEKTQQNNGSALLKAFRDIGQLKYSDYQKLETFTDNLGVVLHNYLCFQFQMQPTDFKTFKTLFG